MINITYNREWTTGNKAISPRRNGSHTVEEQTPYRGGMAIHRRNSREDTDPNDHCNMLIPSGKRRNDATNGLQTANSYWPPVGPHCGSVQTTFPSRLNTTDREKHNNTTPVACMWRKCSEAINMLRTTATQQTAMFLHTHKLTATRSSLSERAGIGDLH